MMLLSYSIVVTVWANHRTHFVDHIVPLSAVELLRAES
jgi:hypothetical protein